MIPTRRFDAQSLKPRPGGGRRRREGGTLLFTLHSSLPSRQPDPSSLTPHIQSTRYTHFSPSYIHYYYTGTFLSISVSISISISTFIFTFSLLALPAWSRYLLLAASSATSHCRLSCWLSSPDKQAQASPSTLTRHRFTVATPVLSSSHRRCFCRFDTLLHPIRNHQHSSPQKSSRQRTQSLLHQYLLRHLPPTNAPPTAKIHSASANLIKTALPPRVRSSSVRA